MDTKAVVLLSGGLDSAYNLWKAQFDHQILLAITFDYGQRAAKREIDSAQKLSSQLNVPHRVIELPWFKDFTQTSLVNGDEDVPQGAQVEIDHLKTSQATAKAVWVPNRNGIFLNIGAAYAEGLGADIVLTGFNLEEATTFPDNTIDYLNSLDMAFSYSTANKVKVKSYCGAMTKTQIIQDAIKIKLPFKDLWPCYLGQDHWCGKCESCQRFSRAWHSAHGGPGSFFQGEKK